MRLEMFKGVMRELLGAAYREYRSSGGNRAGVSVEESLEDFPEDSRKNLSRNRGWVPIFSVVEPETRQLLGDVFVADYDSQRKILSFAFFPESESVFGEFVVRNGNYTRLWEDPARLIKPYDGEGLYRDRKVNDSCSAVDDVLGRVAVEADFAEADVVTEKTEVFDGSNAPRMSEEEYRALEDRLIREGKILL